ncbi:MAG: hypothetical protein ACKV0T_29515 [Planctomycetales bacterium]
MINRSAPLRIVPIVWLVCGLPGCGQHVYRAETQWHADGKVTRAVFQPRDETPQEAQHPALWRRMTASKERPPERWPRAIADLPDFPADSEHPYFVADGEFESAANLPATFFAKPPAGIPPGKLVVATERLDFVFVTEHRWNETLTDSVSLPDLKRACEELSELAVELATTVLKEDLEEACDISSLADWGRSDGKAWLTAAALEFYASGARRELNDADRMSRRFADLCLPFGLVLTDPGGNPLALEEWTQAVRDFLRQLLQKHVRRPDGRPLPAEELDRILSALNDDGNATSPDQAAAQQQRFEKLFKKFCDERFGGTKEFEQHVWGLVTRIVGLYYARLLAPPRRMHYTLSAPGRILSTNGELLSDRAVEWSFRDLDAFPLGYRMECRSLTVDKDRQKQLLGRQPLDTFPKQTQFARLVASDGDLQRALRACHEAEQLTPLWEYRKGLWNSGTPESWQRLQRLWKLLELPEKTP